MKQRCSSVWKRKGKKQSEEEELELTATAAALGCERLADLFRTITWGGETHKAVENEKHGVIISAFAVRVPSP